MTNFLDMDWRDAKQAVRWMSDAELSDALRSLMALDWFAAKGHIRLVVREQLRRVALRG